MEEGKKEGEGSGEVKMEEGEAGCGGRGEVKMEEGEEESGGSGQVKTEELKVDLYKPIDEEKKKLFYAYYNDSGSDGCVKCKTGDYPWEWFEKMLTMGKWLDDSHIDEVLTLMRLQQSNNGDILFPHFAITDMAFGQSLVTTYDILTKKVNGGGATRGGKRKRMARKDFDSVLDDFRFDERMMQYVWGERPKYGNNWANVKRVYCIVNIKDMHWITVVWLLQEGLL